MSLTHRIARLEARAPDPRQQVVPIVIDGSNPQRAHDRLQAARAVGHPIRLIRVGVCLWAADEAAGRRELAEHQERHPGVPATVFKLPAGPNAEVLLEFDPGLPDWVEQAEAW